MDVKDPICNDCIHKEVCIGVNVLTSLQTEANKVVDVWDERFNNSPLKPFGFYLQTKCRKYKCI